MRYLATVSYVGLKFVGFQKQKNGYSIQEEIENALKKYFNEEVKIFYASRTDAKVHSYGQKISFDINKEIKEEKFLRSINALLCEDVAFLKIEKVDEHFLIRQNIKYKHYRYLVNLRKKDPFRSGFSYLCCYDLDLEKLKECAKLFLGYHDFGSFNTTSYEVVKDQCRNIFDIKISLKDEMLILDFYGDGFLRHMIRIIVGTLIEVARGKIDILQVKKMLDFPSKDNYHRYNIDACGLYLVEVVYK